MPKSCPLVESIAFPSWEGWSKRTDVEQGRLRDHWLMERAMEKLPAEDLWSGHCALCGRAAKFSLSTPAGGDANFREELHCPGCGLSARLRAGIHLGMQDLPPDAAIYITEQASRPFAWLQRHYPDVIGSEFTTDPQRIAALTRVLNDELGGTGGIRFEDVTRLSMETATLDLAMSFDVLEHVPDYRAALSEFARVLKPGGRLVLTAPFIQDRETTLVRARLDAGGDIEHLLEPEYHGDPVSGGILCLYHFGWDLTDHAREAGFGSARMVLPWAPGLGYCGGLWTLVATR